MQNFRNINKQMHDGRSCSWIVGPLKLRDIFVVVRQCTSDVLDFARVAMKVSLESNTVTDEPRDFVVQKQVTRFEYCIHFVLTGFRTWGNFAKVGARGNCVYILCNGSAETLKFFACAMETQNKHLETTRVLQRWIWLNTGLYLIINTFRGIEVFFCQAAHAAKQCEL